MYWIRPGTVSWLNPPMVFSKKEFLPPCDEICNGVSEDREPTQLLTASCDSVTNDLPVTTDEDSLKQPVEPARSPLEAKTRPTIEQRPVKTRMQPSRFKDFVMY